MKTRLLFSAMLLVLITAAWWLWPASHPQTASEPTSSANAPATGTGRRTAPVEDASLVRADKMAAFIDQYIASLPPGSEGIVPHLRGIQAVFFASDYILAAKTNSRLRLSKSAIVAAFAQVSPDTSMLQSQLDNWAGRPWSLDEHYRVISDVPAAKESIKAVKAAMTGNSVPIDPQTELLMDCIRYAAYKTDIQEMYGPTPKESEPTHNPAALRAFSETADAVFQHRFVDYYGLDARTVSNLMNQIGNLRIYGLSPADTEIPVVSFQGD